MNRDDLAAMLGRQPAAMALYATGKGLKQPWGISSGMADSVAGRPLTVDTPLRVASNTKTFVAATVLRLWEQGLVDLDGPIAPLLTPLLNELLSGAGYRTGKISVRQLLNHSAGLNDHADDPRYFETVLREPARFWTREEQVRLAVQYSPPLSEAGRRFRYSDTGYILLGDIIERISGETLAATVRRQMSFDWLGLTSTWWEIAEPQPEEIEPRAHQFLGEIDATDVSASMDPMAVAGWSCRRVTLPQSSPPCSKAGFSTVRQRFARCSRPAPTKGPRPTASASPSAASARPIAIRISASGERRPTIRQPRASPFQVSPPTVKRAAPWCPSWSRYLPRRQPLPPSPEPLPPTAS